jgi:hypothetical protein
VNYEYGEEEKDGSTPISGVVLTMQTTMNSAFLDGNFTVSLAARTGG